MIENLAYITKEGMKKFLTTQKKKWECPTCVETVCCHNGICFHRDLGAL